ncbi:MAG: redox-regulated ATPase YchF [Candidatus Delongbacteria bacterium]|nr:redox-regulated ATPase YchF [Candidatus Delongbacteria bacterium]
MGIIAGIVGITNTGKTTIFNALTSSEAESTSYSFSTVKPNIAIVDVPDKRVDEIFNNITSNKKVYNHMEVMDIAGLVKGSASGEGLGNKFLGDIKQVDAILHVVRCFDDDNIVHVDGSVNPARDMETIDAELIMKDLETVENRLAKNDKLVKAKNKEAILLQPIYEKLHSVMSELEHPRSIGLNDDELKLIKDMNLLTFKPMIFVCNISEDELMAGKDSEYTSAVKKYAAERNYGVVSICGKVEAEIAMLDEEEKREFLIDYGLEEPGLNLLLKETYSLLGLSTFLTEGEIEVKAWNIKKGMTAPQAAGVIHTDFENRFIKADVISYDDFVASGFDRAVARQNGKARLEGKSYIVQDGDVIIFRFGK